MVWYLYLSETPDSHFEIAVLETNRASASSSCVKPLLLLNSFSFSWGLSYTPCLLLKPDLRLRLHATQAQPCFPAASNALALPGGNGIFTATPTERITHYTLLRKVVCQMGALPPLETPTRKGGTLPLHGAHTAFSCYPALRLYRLSKSQRGNGVVSLSK